MDSSAAERSISTGIAAEAIAQPDAPSGKQADANTDAMDVRKEPLSVLSGADILPGLRIFHGPPSQGVDDVLEVIKLLNTADIPACIIGVHALRYYGAGRGTWECDVCVPAGRLKDAVAIFKRNNQYEPAKPPPPQWDSLRHLNPIFQLKDIGFCFILTPSSQVFIDPRPEYCELSNKSVPYPQMQQFVRSLLLLQDDSDLADFVDGMNLDEEWGEKNIDFDDLQAQGVEFNRVQNAELMANGLSQYNVNVDYRSRWNEVIKSKDRRISPMKRGRYKSRWRRIKNDIDPRQRDRPF